MESVSQALVLSHGPGYRNRIHAESDKSIKDKYDDKRAKLLLGKRHASCTECQFGNGKEVGQCTILQGKVGGTFQLWYWENSLSLADIWAKPHFVIRIHDVRQSSWHHCDWLDWKDLCKEKEAIKNQETFSLWRKVWKVCYWIYCRIVWCKLRIRLWKGSFQGWFSQI